MSDGDTRVDPFASLGQFKAKPKVSESEQNLVQEDIEKISKDNGFPSREPQPAEEKPAKRARRKFAEPRVQLNIKATQEGYDRFYEMANERGIRLGDLLDQALDALVFVEKKRKAKHDSGEA
ncbi:stability/partitioning determinant [Pseudomonas sp. P5_152]|uniref:stability/partitioning determinant n=1 Tax=Pseudomonas sp. P5_152 TaxID=3043442 RepID=UPI002A37210F|nr:stability/partitioning determinant [Pseudomonas sp. P5_152]MDX9668606.1 stability/partitioning determinant [Pseudomonas sp. P5_152]